MSAAVVSGAGAWQAPDQYTGWCRRALSPAETLRRLQPALRAAQVTRLAPVHRLDRVGIPVVIATRPMSLSVCVAQGKGVDLESARVSAAMEALETFHGECASGPLVYRSFREMRGGGVRCIPPYSLPLLRRGSYTPDRRFLWIEGRNELDGLGTWVPYELVHTDYRCPSVRGSGCFSTSTTGLAAGNTLDEAKLHALCEIIERDALTLWRYVLPEERRRRRVDLGSLDEQSGWLVERFSRCGLDLGLWDISTEFGVPAFLCHVVESNDPIGGTLRLDAGSAAHPEPALAVARAVLEAAQSRLTRIMASRDDYDRAFVRQPRQAAVRHVLERIRRQPANARLDDIPPIRCHDAGEAVGQIAGRMASAGHEEIATVDLTQPDLGVSCVRILASGLEDAEGSPWCALGSRASSARKAWGEDERRRLLRA